MKYQPMYQGASAGTITFKDLEFEQQVRAITNEVAEMLIAKNQAYGNAALDPVRIFSKAPVHEQINVRLDDKLSRISRGDENMDDEDVEKDLLGYLVIRRIARRLSAG